MDFDFRGKAALVTGLVWELGRATALALGRCGAKVAVHYGTSEEQAQQVVRAINDGGGEAFLVQADVASPQEVDAMVKKVFERFTHLDFLVNNAGTLVERRPFKEMSLELWRRVIDVNLTSVYLVTRAVIEPMLERGSGNIVNVASIAGYNGGGWGASPDATAKGAVIAPHEGARPRIGRNGTSRQLCQSRSDCNALPRSLQPAGAAKADCGRADCAEA